MRQFRSSDDGDDDQGRCSATTRVPFDWEETPGTTKSHLRLDPEERQTVDGEQTERINSRRSSEEKSAANEVIEGSKIRPLKLPPRLEVVQLNCGSRAISARWTKSSPITSPWYHSPRQRQKINEFDPFAKAIEQTISSSRSKGRMEPKGKDVTKRRPTKDPPLLKPASEERPSSALILPNKAVARDVKFSSFRSMYEEYGPRHRRTPTTSSVVGSSLRWPLPEDQLPSHRRPLLQRLGFRPAIHRVFKKVFGSSQ